MIKRIIPWILILCIFAGCRADTAPEETTAPLTYPMETDFYSPALDKLLAAPDIMMTVSTETTVKIGGESLNTRHNKQLILNDAGISVSGTVEYGTYSMKLEEVYTDGMLYQTINDSRFCGAISSEDYFATLVPVAILDPALYDSILVSDGAENTTVQFSQATQAESWALPAGAQYLTSQGTATISAQGELENAAYELEYAIGQATVSYRVLAQYSTATQNPITVPNAEEYTLLEDIRGPMLIEQAYGFLQQTRSTDAVLVEDIFSQANSLQYDNTITISRDEQTTSVETLTTLTDQGRGGEVSSYRQTEQFQNDTYTICVNDGEPETLPRIDSLAMHTYCINLLTEKIMSSRHIMDCKSEVKDGQLFLTYTAGEELAETICRSSCATLYQDELFLDNQTDRYEDYAVSFLLTVDLITGLPYSSGLEFHGIHHIDGINYALETHYEQTYKY